MVAGPTWQCSDCDTYNDAAVRVCHVCETPRAAIRRDAPEPPAGKKAVPKTPATKRAPATKKAAPTKKATPTRRPPAAKKSAAAKRTPVTESPSTSGRRTPPDRRPGMTGPSSPTVRGGAAPPLAMEALFGSSTAPVRTPTREATRGELVAGCGCLLFLAAVVIVPIVLLILNWSAVTSFVTGSDSSKPSPTASASGPCPEPMAEMLPEGAGARLVAAYSRDDLEERYAFCRTTAGKVFYFARMKDGEPYGDPTEARQSENGYVVDFMPQGTSYHFRDGEVAAYDEDGKEIWTGELVPEASAD
ncbi:hypothetical protein [Streptomyces tendae]|uniref:hypothetical protein n=1 Tax=Streptomyces tendae TaxID=1932 RepID=UPI001330E54C|nr:hypothetical protein [Streptomyces tendae]